MPAARKGTSQRGGLRSFRATPQFWRAYRALSPDQKKAAAAKFLIFQADPFDQRLRTHRINKLSARYKKTVWAVEIESNLRAVFYAEDDAFVSIDIGAHDIYK